MGGLCVCARGLDIEKLIKLTMIYSVSYFDLGGLVRCLGRLSPPKPPRGDGTGLVSIVSMPAVRLFVVSALTIFFSLACGGCTFNRCAFNVLFQNV